MRRTRSRTGQALVEFALIVPVFILILGAIVQFGLIFWAQNTLTQVVRDTGRWAATQTSRPCSSDANKTRLVAKADSIAQISGLLSYSAGQWKDLSVLDFDVSPAPREGVEVSWPLSTDETEPDPNDCPPNTADVAWFINIRAHHVVPVFFPLIAEFVPACGSDGCSLSSSVQFRMEPSR